MTSSSIRVTSGPTLRLVMNPDRGWSSLLIGYSLINLCNLFYNSSEMRRPSNEEGLGSTKNMRVVGSQEAPTQGKENRDFEYTIYEQTTFEALKTQFFNVSQRLRSQRLMEHLGRYKPKEDKQSHVNMFKSNFMRLKELLLLMSKEAEKYKGLLSATVQVKESKSTNVSCDYEVSFRKKIRKDLKDIQNCWIELFIEGSLKRLIPILNLLRIQEDEIDFGLDIIQWHIEIESKFENYQRMKSCCCA